MANATLTGPVPGDPFLMVPAHDAQASGYVAEEWFLSGDAERYALDGERGDDGRWSARGAGAAAFRTRIVVRRPEDPSRFNGTVLVEWLNVSGGLDAAPDWMFLHRHLIREGAAWVGVSAQKAGIDGGGLVPGMPLKQANAERYGDLLHPGDAHAFDLYSEVARALRTPGSGPLGPLVPERLIAIGESQSAGFLVSYVNAIDPMARCYDAFLIHGRPGTAAGVDGNYLRASSDRDVARSSAALHQGHRLRENVRVPVLTFQSETDVVRLGSGRARQPDSEHLRLWELAGASHFDTYGLLASHVDREGVPIDTLAERLAPTDQLLGMTADSLVNSGPQQHYVLGAAVSHLDRWVRDGTPPPEAPRLEAADPHAALLTRDELGIVRGGIRTPWVDAPSAALSGEPPGGDGFMFLFGKTVPFDPQTLDRLYPGGPDEHVDRFDRATEQAIGAGFLLEADAEEIRALARYGRQPSGWRIG